MGGINLKSNVMKLEDIYFREMQFSEFVNDIDASNQCAKIAENFAIGFAEWLMEQTYNDWPQTKQLLEIYKETL